MQSYQNLKFVLENDILTVFLNRPKALNALNRSLLLELEYFFKNDATAMTHLKGIILTGAGEKSFVAGADIKEFTAATREDIEKQSRWVHSIFNYIERFPKPVIAAVNGFALGGGCELAMACHLRVANEKARFGQPEVNLGLIPGYGGTQRLVQYIGKTKAMELLLTAKMIKADEAYRLGLVNYVVPVGEELEKAKELIELIATKAPIAIAKTIDAVNAYFDKTQDGFEVEIKSFGDLAETEDFVEGAKAFVEKRAAHFKGK